PNLWGAIVGRPGTMKSHQIAEATRPLRRLEAQEWDQFEAFEAEAKAHVARIEAEIEAVKGKMREAARGKSVGKSLDELQRQLAEKIEERDAANPRVRRYIT